MMINQCQPFASVHFIAASQRSVVFKKDIDMGKNHFLSLGLDRNRDSDGKPITGQKSLTQADQAFFSNHGLVELWLRDPRWSAYFQDRSLAFAQRPLREHNSASKRVCIRVCRLEPFDSS
jgi:hypothetical protein